MAHLDLHAAELAIIKHFRDTFPKTSESHLKRLASKYIVRLSPALHDLAIQGWHDVIGPVILAGFHVTRGPEGMAGDFQFVVAKSVGVEAKA